jgi:hypothetical protein
MVSKQVGNDRRFWKQGIVHTRANLLFLAFAVFALILPERSEGKVLRDESALIEIEPIGYYFQKADTRLDLTSSKARLWRLRSLALRFLALLEMTVLAEASLQL